MSKLILGTVPPLEEEFPTRARIGRGVDQEELQTSGVDGRIHGTEYLKQRYALPNYMVLEGGSPDKLSKFSHCFDLGVLNLQTDKTERHEVQRKQFFRTPKEPFPDNFLHIEDRKTEERYIGVSYFHVFSWDWAGCIDVPGDIVRSSPREIVLVWDKKLRRRVREWMRIIDLSNPLINSWRKNSNGIYEPWDCRKF